MTDTISLLFSLLSYSHMCLDALPFIFFVLISMLMKLLFNAVNDSDTEISDPTCDVLLLEGLELLIRGP